MSVHSAQITLHFFNQPQALVELMVSASNLLKVCNEVIKKIVLPLDADYF